MSRRDVEDVYPLSPVQQGMLYHSLLEPGGGAYLAQVLYRLRGDLDVDALRRALERTLEAYTVLRTAFVWEGLDEPLQVVSRRVEAPLRQVSADSLPGGLEELTRRDRDAGLKLAAAPLTRFTLVSSGDGAEHHLLWTFHHLVLDGWSVPLVVRRILALYQALADGRPEPALPRPRPYRDYIARLGSRDAEAGAAFWRRLMAGAELPTPLGPAAEPSPGAAGSHRGEHRVTVDPAVADSLEKMARRRHLTVSTLLQGAWALLLSRYARSRDVTFGVTTSGRPADLSGAEEMVGLFINTLPLRAQADPGAGLFDWLAGLQAQGLEAREHDATPLVEIARLAGAQAGDGLFDSVLVFENFPSLRDGGDDEAASPEAADGPSVEQRSFDAPTHYPLTLLVRPQPLTLLVENDRRRVSDAAARRLGRHLAHLLAAMAEAGDDTRLGELDHVDADERRRLVERWNDTARPRPEDLTLHRWALDGGDADPAAEAVRFAGGALSRRELDERSADVARALVARGVGVGDVVGIALERSLNTLPALLGVLRAGAAYLPLEPDLPAHRLDFIAADAGCAQVITEDGLDAGLAERLAAGGRSLVTVSALVREGGRDGAGEETALPRVPATAAAYVLYTSGSTGRPKGVAVPHRAIVNRLLWMQEEYGLGEGDRVLQKTPLGFDVSLWELFWPGGAGVPLVFAEPGGHRDPAYLVRTLVEERITTVHFVPSLLAAFLDAPEVESCAATLRRVVVSGEALPAALVERFFRRLPGVELHNLYGPTEAAVDVSAWPCEADTSAGVPIGRPIANVHLHVLDRRFAPAGVGVAGELVIGGGTALAHGYRGRPALTAERFVPDPLSVEPGRRLYRTGDLARFREDGALDFLGRLDHQVKVRGQRIELGEIEAALVAHPGVRDGVVVLRRVAAEDRLVAYVVATRGGDDGLPSPEGLRDFLRQSLPEAMVPVHVLRLEALPRTATGKVDRGSLPAPDLERSTDTPYEAPRTPGEEVLAGLWSQVLGVPRVGRDDDFFALGGHSLTALRLLSRVRDALGVRIELPELLAGGGLARMAARIDAALRRGGDEGGAQGAMAPPPPLLPRPRDEPLPLSLAQQRLWFLHQLEPISAAYNIPLALDFAGPLDALALDAAFRLLVDRHEVLRSRYLVRDGEPRQEAGTVAAAYPGLRRVDLAGLPERRRREELERLRAAEAVRPFDLAGGPLLRTALLRTAVDRHTLLFTLHHVVADARSLVVASGELAHLYAGVHGRSSAPLPELPVQYADYAAWEREHLGEGAVETAVEWWRERLAGSDEILELPTDRPRPAVQSSAGGHLAMDLPPDLVAGVEALARNSGTTPFMVMLAGWLTLLRRYGGQRHISVGTTTAGRDLPATEALVGCFVKTLVLRTEVDGGGSFSDLLAGVRETTLAAYAHSDVPFERLVDELQPERDLSTTPLFQVMLTFHQDDPSAAGGSATVPQLPGVTVASRSTATRTAKFDLELEVSWRRAGARANFEYATALFDRTTVARMGRHLARLLSAAVEAPQTPLRRLPLLPASEHFQVLHGWNDTRASAVPLQRTFAELFRDQVDRTPQRVAATFRDQALTYSELDRRSETLARRLVARGFGPERVVALFTPRDLGALTAILAVFKAGGAYVPLDPLHPSRRLSRVLAASGAELALVASELGDEMERVVAEAGRGEGAASPRVLDLDRLLSAPDADDAAGDTRVELPAGDPRHLAYVIFTSGSTGTPKGAMLEQRGMVNHLFAKILDLGLGPGDAVAQNANISFDVHVWQFLVALLVGGRTDVYDDEESLDARRLLARMEETGSTVVETVPSQLRVLLEERERLGDDAPGLGRLRWMIPNGEVLPPELCEGWFEAYPHTSMINAYGPTECSDDVLHHAMHRPPAQDQAVPIGRPLPNLRLYVTGPAFEPLPMGAAGDLYIAGAGVGRGYLGDPRRTAVTFLPDPFSDQPGGRLYRTGDRGRWRPDGRLDFLGRIDFQVKIRGFRIEPGEIEAALRSHDAVEQAVVVPRRDGARETYLCAYVVLAGEAAERVSVADVQLFLAGRVPPYMIPARFVMLDELPLTTNGKVDRKALPAPEDRGEQTVPYEEPRAGTEATVAAVWSEVLGVEKVGRHDNFFGLGGHSLSATRVTMRLADALGLEVPVRTLFLQPTVAQLAAVLDKTAAASASTEAKEAKIRELRERIARMKAEAADGQKVGT